MVTVAAVMITAQTSQSSCVPDLTHLVSSAYLSLPSSLRADTLLPTCTDKVMAAHGL